MNIEDEPVNLDEIKRLLNEMKNTIKSIEAKITQSQIEQEKRLKDQVKLELTEHEKETDLYQLITNEKIERLVVERNHWKHEVKKLSVDLEKLEHRAHK